MGQLALGQMESRVANQDNRVRRVKMRVVMIHAVAESMSPTS
jgi:hypothetical protein